MRDGVYKGLPLPEPYRRLVRACEREAERGDAARGFALRAVEYDIRRELPSGFVKRLMRMADEVGAGLPGLSALGACGSSRDAGGRNSALANDVLAHAQRLAQDGYSGRGLVERAFVGGLRGWRERRIRQIEEHCIPQDARATAETSADALRAADLEETATLVLDDHIRGSGQPLRASINLDEDLPLQ